MRSRYPSASSFSYSFGPGPLTPAIKALIAVNVVVFLASLFVPLVRMLGLRPADVVQHFAAWQLVTYMFLHAGPMHLLFNMLALWMFGVELERMWGTTYFTKFYFITGVCAGLTQLLLGILPLPFAGEFYGVVTIGASGAIYGLLLAYAMYFPDRPIYMYFVFPVPARYFVLIMGGISLFSSVTGGGGVAHATHLGGLLVAYLFLKRSRFHPLAEMKYRYLKWKINRVRKKFDVYSGGRANDWDHRVH